MVTGIRLPYKLVIAGHIVREKLRSDARILLDIDVNNAQNGVLGVLPSKRHGLSTRYVSRGQSPRTLTLFSFWMTVCKDIEVPTYAKSVKGIAKKKLIKCLAGLTFGQLHGKDMTFLNRYRPYKRAFAVMSHLKHQWAAEEGSIPMFNAANYDNFNLEMSKVLPAQDIFASNDSEPALQLRAWPGSHQKACGVPIASWTGQSLVL